MADTRTCPECGAELPSNAPDGVCPKCLLFAGLDGELASDHETRPPESGDSCEMPTLSTGGAASADDSAVLAPGMTVKYFGDYELLAEIARGGMGVVYRARQTSLNRIVAVKMILSGQLASEQDVHRFRTEAEAAANLDHPGVVPIYEIGEHDGQHYFSMGFVDGKSLADKIKDGPLLPKLAATYVKEVAEAVHYAHAMGIVHRDLKPANILIDSDGTPKVTDFGLAKRVEGDNGMTVTGQVMGTPSYMPPEQAAGRTRQIGPLSDVYSLGAILYCLLVGRPPFHADSPVETLIQVLERDPTSPRNLEPALDLDLETITLKCLQKQPDQRYASARELADELDRFVNGLPIRARPISTKERLWRWCQRNPVVTTLSALSLGTLVVATVISTLFGYTAVRTSGKLEDELNVNRIALAARELQANSLLRARTILEKSTEKHTWEYAFVKQLCYRTPRNQLPSLGASVVNARLVQDQNSLIIVTENGNVAVRDLITGSETCRIPTPFTGPADRLRSFAASDDGDVVALAGPDSLSLIRLSTHETAWTRTEDGTIEQVAVSPNGESLAVVSGTKSPVLTFRLTKDGSKISTVNLDAPARLCRFDKVGETVFVHIGTALWKYDVVHAAGSEVRANLPRAGSKDLVIFNADASQIALIDENFAADTHGITLEKSSGSAASCRHIRTPDIPHSVSFSPDGRLIAASMLNPILGVGSPGIGSTVRDWYVYVYDTETGELLRSISGYRGELEGLSFSRSGAQLIGFGATDQRGTVVLWDSRPSTSRRLVGHSDYITDIAVSRDDTYLFTASGDGTVRVWDIATGMHRRTFDSPRGQPVKSISCAAKENLLAICGGARLVVWNWRTGKVQATINVDPMVSRVALRPDGRQVAYADYNKVVVFDVAIGEAQFEVRDLKGARVTYSPSGAYLLIHGSTNRAEQEAWLVDAQTGEVRTRLKRVSGSPVFSANGNRVVFLGKSIRGFDARTGNEVFESGGKNGFDNGNKAWNEKAKRLAMVVQAIDVNRSVIEIRNSDSGRLVHTLRGHRSAISYLLFTHDGHRLVSGDISGNIHIWETPGFQTAK